MPGSAWASTACGKELGGIPENAPDGGMPVPDMMLGSSAVCDPRFKWYQAAGRYLEVPTYSIDVVGPPVYADLNEVRDYYIRYQKEQFQGSDRLSRRADRQKNGQGAPLGGHPSE